MRMNNLKKRQYFVISDLHGYYDEMLLALEKYNYDFDNPNHHLIVVGDLFDRGIKSKEVLEYIYSLCIQDKATVVLGNHDNFLIELFDEKYSKVLFNIKHNGTSKTLESLIGRKLKDFSDLDSIREEIIVKYPYLESWLKSLPLFLEIGDYIFVHGGIDGSNKNWRNGEIRDFVWGRQTELPTVENKTMVVGHQRVVTIRYPGENYHKIFKKHPEAFDILKKDKKIFIDSFVEISKMINVLVLEI